MFSNLLGVFGVANLGFVWDAAAIIMVSLAGFVSLGAFAFTIIEICKYFGYGLNKSYTSEDSDNIKSGYQAAKERRLAKRLKREQEKAARKEKAGVQDEEFSFDEPKNEAVEADIEAIEEIETIEEVETVEETKLEEKPKTQQREPDEMSD